MQIFLFFALFIAILAILFAVQNNAPTTVSFAIWDFEGSLALILLFALAAGALISFFLSIPSNVKAKLQNRTHRKRITELEMQLENKEKMLQEAEQKSLDFQKALEPPKEEVVDVLVSESPDESEQVS